MQVLGKSVLTFKFIKFKLTNFHITNLFNKCSPKAVIELYGFNIHRLVFCWPIIFSYVELKIIISNDHYMAKEKRKSFLLKTTQQKEEKAFRFFTQSRICLILSPPTSPHPSGNSPHKSINDRKKSKRLRTVFDINATNTLFGTFISTTDTRLKVFFHSCCLLHIQGHPTPMKI